MDNHKHIFISYSRKDEKDMERLQSDLEAAGIPTWTDKKLELGADWDREIEAAIKGADKIVVVITPNAIQSEWVEDEIRISEKFDKLIVPVLISCDVPKNASPIFSLEPIDMRENYAERFEQLTAILLNNLPNGAN